MSKRPSLSNHLSGMNDRPVPAFQYPVFRLADSSRNGSRESDLRRLSDSVVPAMAYIGFVSSSRPVTVGIMMVVPLGMRFPRMITSSFAANQH
jgi:hypothetical protein